LPGGLRIAFLSLLAGVLLAAQGGVPQAAGSQPATVQPAAPENAAKVESAPSPDVAQKPAAPAPSVAETKSDAQKPPAAPPNSAAPKATDSAKRYVIGPLDLLQVKVWNQTQISGMVDVHQDGMISLPLVGEIKADGLTTLQLKEAITTRLNEVLTAPEVDVSVVKVNSKHYQIYGGVLRGGEFPLVERTTIADALALADLKEFAKTTKIEVRRGSQVLHFNYKDFLKGRNMDKNPNFELQNGDTVIVPE
jgi:polysaccharide export outer membrane protein